MSHDLNVMLPLPVAPVTGLQIDRITRRQVVEHLRGCLPCEGVGLLSVRDTGLEYVVERYYPGRNSDASRTRYTMAPGDVAEALRDIASSGTRLGAIVHSHPCTPPVPSRIDLAEAALPHVLLVIVAFQPAVDLRAWRLIVNDEGVASGGVEVPLVTPIRGIRQWFRGVDWPPLVFGGTPILTKEKR